MMFNFTKKKTIIGSIGVVLSMVMAAVLLGFDKGGPITDLTGGEMAIRLFGAVGIALALGFGMLILFDWRMFLLIAGLMGLLIIVQFVVNVDISVGLAVFTVLLAGGGIFGFTVQYRNCKYALNGATSARQKQEEQKQIELIQKILAEDEEIKRSIRYLDKSIVLWAPMGAVFQVIKREHDYYFHHIGTVFTKPDWTNLITDFDNIELNSHKKDYAIDRADIVSITAILRDNPQVMDLGTVKIKVGDKRAKSYGFINRIDEEELKTFFGEEITVSDKIKKAEPQDEEEVTDSRKEILNKINLGRYIFSMLAIVFFAVYIFYNNAKTDLVFTLLAIVICLTPIVTCFVLREYISIRDIGKNSQPDKDKISFLFTLIIFPLLFAIKCLLTAYSIVDYDYLKLILYSLIPLAVLLVVFFLACKEFKKYKSCIASFLIAAIAFSPSFIYKANSAFDLKEPQEVVCQVTEKPTHTNNNGEVTYYFVIAYGDKTVKTEVDEETYNDMTEGGEVTLLRYHGAFGIQNTYLK